MKSIKDAINLYRTMAAEALERFVDDERGQDIGYWLENQARSLEYKIRPPRDTRPFPEGWTEMGWTTDEGIDFPAIFDEIQSWQGDAIGRYIDSMAERMVARPHFVIQDGSLFAGLMKPPPKLDEVPRSMQRDEWTPADIAREQYKIPKFNVPSFAEFDTSGIEPWQEKVQDSVNDIIRRLAEAREDAMRGTIRHTFIAGVDPESEWTQISRARVEKMATIPTGEDPVGDWIMGIPLYDDPNDVTMLRMKTADIFAAPNGPKIIETVFGDAEDPQG